MGKYMRKVRQQQTILELRRTVTFQEECMKKLLEKATEQETEAIRWKANFFETVMLVDRMARIDDKDVCGKQYGNIVIFPDIFG